MDGVRTLEGGRGRLDRAAQGGGRPLGAQRIGVVDAVAASQRQTRSGSSSCPPRWPAPARPRSRHCWTSSGRPRCWARVAGRSRPALAKGCSFESGIMVLYQQNSPREGALNRCYHATTPTGSKSPSTTTDWWPLQDANLTPSIGGFGLTSSRENQAQGQGRMGIMVAVNEGAKPYRQTEPHEGVTVKELRAMSEVDLLQAHSAVIGELRRRNVVKTGEQPNRRLYGVASMQSPWVARWGKLSGSIRCYRSPRDSVSNQGEAFRS